MIIYRRDKRQRTTSGKNTVTKTTNALTSQDVSAFVVLYQLKEKNLGSELLQFTFNANQ
ncbi:MAG: hypothetical protein ACJAT4_001207 [Granulosicoccus sp.]